ncbi:MAG TPA: Zn-dependent alcohol dehydrogenase, partial [Myxococcota bacterium]
AIYQKPHTPLTIEDVELSDLRADEVLVRTVCSGVCHSDMHFVDGLWALPMPAVLGHEASGVVERVGANVGYVKPGDRVIMSFKPFCGQCYYCIRGEAHLCNDPGLAARGAQHLKWQGKPVLQMASVGSFSEYMITPESGVVKIPADMPMAEAALIGCGVMTGVGAAINTAQIKPGSSVIIFGAGGVGIAAIQGARIAGAAEIVAVDKVDSKLELALKFGATHAIRPEAVESTKASVTGGEGFDYAIECVGHPALIRQSFDVTRRGGTAVIVGVGRLTEEVKFNAFEMFYHEKNLKGSMFGSANVRLDFDRLLRLWKYGKLDLEGMISRRIKLGEVNEAFRAMQQGEVIRSVIEYS